ncbi:unnamed protein product [Paramecium sonneborni]|uniref:Dual specificity protein phosphatase n=1 Tax=Paramecium sonneborni TaxID=65129 RepID=A0A8S1KCP7_9CILI|nr:unnamed protein product [Paramecium sonneborni]
MYSSSYTSPNKIIDSNCVDKGNLFLGNKHSTAIQHLEQLQIGAILTVADDINISLPNRNHLIINAQDVPEYQICLHFKECFQFIEQNLQSTNVLVHCFQGASRSATIVAAYLMKIQKIQAKEALQKLKEIRKIVCPNKGFISQLENFEKNLMQFDNSN